MKSLFRKLICEKKKRGKRLFFKNYKKTPKSPVIVGWDWFSEDYRRRTSYSLCRQDGERRGIRGLYMKIECISILGDSDTYCPCGRRIIPLSFKAVYRYWILPYMRNEGL